MGHIQNISHSVASLGAVLSGGGDKKNGIVGEHAASLSSIIVMDGAPFTVVGRGRVSIHRMRVQEPGSIGANALAMSQSRDFL